MNEWRSSRQGRYTEESGCESVLKDNYEPGMEDMFQVGEKHGENIVRFHNMMPETLSGDRNWGGGRITPPVIHTISSFSL